jgi:hypothetical protein
MQPGVAVEIADFIITIITCPLPDVFPLAITIHYSQCTGGREPIDAGAPLAHNGKVVVYSQYFLIEIWVFAYDLAGCIVGVWKPPQPLKALNYLSPRYLEPVAKLFPYLQTII